MGCQSSTQNVHENTTENNKKRNMKSGYSQSERKNLLEAIQWNDACDFAVTSEQDTLPFNAQLSQKGLYWMATHYCCRWNASKVLDYVLRTAYAQDPRNYARFVNEQTVQGYTCLHLCAIWNSTQCLQLLLKFGGLNLQLKDVTQMTPYLTMINYKRIDMKALLKQYEDLGIGFLIVQHERLSTGDILALQNIGQQNNKEEQMLIPQPCAVIVQETVKNLLTQTEQLKQLEAARTKLELEKQNIRAQLKQIELEAARKEKQRTKQTEDQKVKKKQREIQQNEKKLIDQMSRKEQQLSDLKENLKKIQEDRQQTIIREQIKKSEEFLLKNEAQLQSKISVKKSALQQYKESMVKAKAERVSKQEAEIKEEIIGKLPAEMQTLYDEAKRAGVYVDSSFPQTQQSIGTSATAKKFISDLAWLRPKEIFNGDYHLFDGIDPNDIKQGSLGVCYMLATLSNLAQNPARVKDIFVFSDKKVGFYVLKILIHGEIKYITVDDAIPCSRSTKSPLFAKPNGNELWVCLVQKAWAKCIGNYMKAESMTPNHLMQDLTMCPSFGLWFKDRTEKTKDVDMHCRAKNIVVLTSVADKKIEGIVNNHAYSLLNVYDHEKKNIYKIRNPWGKFEWKGQYHDSSPFWTEQLKTKVGWVDEDDGVFFLSQSELLEAFTYYSICMTQLQNNYSFVSIKTKKDESKYFTFELQEDQEINLRFVQKFNRMLDDAEYKYSPVIFEVGKLQSNGQVNFLTEGDNVCFWGAKTVNADPELLKMYTKGTYFVRIAVQWVNEAKYNTGVFGVFAKQQVKIVQLAEKQGQKYWIQLLKSFALKKLAPTIKDNTEFIMTWMRGQLVCYSYAKQTEVAVKFESKWTFNPVNFVNCTFGLNSVGGTDLKFPIGKGKNGANVGTLKRTLINQSCTSGQVFITATVV